MYIADVNLAIGNKLCTHRRLMFLVNFLPLANVYFLKTHKNYKTTEGFPIQA